tara:strand:- start:346 stop:570 length:225 start_codon:yes stop_codon:yes gene_type:complete
MEAKKHREFVSVTLAEMVLDIKHIKELCDKNEKWLSQLNGRVRKTENTISTIQGIGVVAFALFGGFVTYIVKAI